MKVIGFKTLKIARLILGPNFTDRLSAPRIDERAKSVRRIGILSEPMVRQSDHRVIYGEDRIATLMRCGQGEVRCKVVECTDAELEEIRESENHQRRHDIEEQRAGLLRLLDIYEKQIVEDPVTYSPLPLEPRTQLSPRGLARVRVANEQEIKPASVRKQEQRAKKVRNQKAYLKRKAAREAPPPPDIATMGVDLEDEFSEQIEKISKILFEADVALRRARSVLGTIETDHLPFHRPQLHRMIDAIHDAGVMVRGSKPKALCPYCKGVSGFQELCAGCMQMGWIGSSQAQHVPAEMWEEGEKAVIVKHGQQFRLQDVLAERGIVPEPVVEPMVEREDAPAEEEFFV